MGEVVAFSSPGVGRIFIACDRCRRVMPHYRVYGEVVKTPADGLCKCGGAQFTPIQIAGWKAVAWVLLVGLVWRKWIRNEREWDPRMPIRQR